MEVVDGIQWQRWWEITAVIQQACYRREEQLLGKDKGPIIDTHGRLYWLSLLKVFRFYYIPIMVNKHDITIGVSVNMPRLCTLAGYVCWYFCWLSCIHATVCYRIRWIKIFIMYLVKHSYWHSFVVFRCCALHVPVISVTVWLWLLLLLLFFSNFYSPLNGRSTYINTKTI